jgi:hypothetical protein
MRATYSPVDFGDAPHVFAPGLQMVQGSCSRLTVDCPLDIFTLLTGRNLPKIRQAPEPKPSIINEKAVAPLRALWGCDRL